MSTEVLPLAEVTKRAIEILSRELGPVDTIRFVSQFSKGEGDYTVERERLFENLTLEEVFEEIHKHRKSDDLA